MKNQSDHGDSVLLGCQSYWSSYPLAVELERSGPRYSFIKDDCAGLYRKLETCQLSYAFCSSISLVRNIDFEMAYPLGVSHRGPGSVGIWGLSNAQAPLVSFIEERIHSLGELFRAAQLHRTENLKQGVRAFYDALAQMPVVRPETLPALRLTPGFSSWSSLSRLFYRLIFGVEAYDSMLLAQTKGSLHVSPNEMVEEGIDLRIENEALQKRCAFPHTIDLAELWRDLTGLPFVSTILQKNRRQQGSSCPSSLADTLELAQMRMQVEPCNYYPDMLPRNCQQQSIDLCSVWKGVSYRLDQEDLRSLLIFLYLCKPLEKKSLGDETFTLRMLRWQQRDTSLPM